jgi:hypothetical protein
VLNKVYLTLGSLLLVGYSVVAWQGWEFGDDPRHVTTDPRNPRAGYHHTRSSWWFWGYRGGK